MLLPFDRRALAPQTAELDAWRERLDRRAPLPRRWTGRLRSDLEAEAIAASTSLEGIPVTVDDVRRILAGDPPPSVSAHDEALVRGYREAMEFVLRRADDPSFEWNRELIVSVQDRVLAGRFEDGAGRLRTRSALVVRRDAGEVVFRPPPEGAVPGLVDEMCQVLSASDAHPAVVAAWAHVAMAAIHPFLDGNGRTARILASLVMYRGGFRTRPFTTLEEWWGRHPTEYYAAFACLGETFDPGADVGPFVSEHVGAQISQVKSVDLRERTYRGVWTLLENVLLDAGLPDRLATALWDAFFGRSVTAGYYRGMVDVSRATATNDLRAGTARQLLRAEGNTRGRQYVAGPALWEELTSRLRLDNPQEPGAARAVVVDELLDRLVEAGELPGRSPEQIALFG
ncbi:MAG TPA: Fic family protein [Solirubrobacteraceae bacterium]|nr:Fic family protein [Solirubrobacteraceae bacterium]